MVMKRLLAILTLIVMFSLIVGVGINWPSVTGVLGRDVYRSFTGEATLDYEVVSSPPKLPTTVTGVLSSSVTTTYPTDTPTAAPVEDVWRYLGKPVREDRMIIKTGRVKLTVSNITLAYQQLVDLALRFNGYVHSSNGFKGDATVELRIPSSRFEEAMLMVQQIGRVESVSISTQDVTEQVIDLRSRLNASRALESRLLQLLDKAVTVDDVLKIEDQLTRVRADIERMEAQLKRLIGKVEYASIVVELSVRYKIYRIELSCETFNVQDEFNNLVLKAGTVGRIVESWSGADNAYIMVEVKTADTQEIENLIEAKIVDRKIRIIESSIDRSTILIKIAKPKTVEVGVDVVSTVQSGLNAMVMVVSLMVSGVLALIPVLLVGGAGYLGYKVWRTKGKVRKAVGT